MNPFETLTLSVAARAVAERLARAGRAPEADDRGRLWAACACFDPDLDGDPTVAPIETKQLLMDPVSGALECHGYMGCGPAEIAHSIGVQEESPLGSNQGSTEVDAGTTDDGSAPGALQLPIGDWGKDYEKVAQLRPLLQADFEDGPCVIPGHKDCTGRIALSESQHWRYRCVGAGGLSTYSLAEVLASAAFGEARRLRGPSQWLWFMRLWFDAGLLELPTRTELPSVPPKTRAAVHVARAAISLLFDLKRMYEGFSEAAVVCAAEFLAAFTHGLRGGPITKDQARDAVTEMLLEGVLVSPGKHGRSRLFLPGPGRAAPGGSPDVPAEGLGQDGEHCPTTRPVPVVDPEPAGYLAEAVGGGTLLGHLGSVDRMLEEFVRAFPPKDGKSGLSVTA